MAEYVIFERAKNDLREIADYTQNRWPDAQAGCYVRMLLGEFARLADKPLIGRSYDNYRVGLRGVFVWEACCFISCFVSIQSACCQNFT